MAFIRKRVTKNGVVSTALVEAYREGGKPKHRVIANLHGAETLTVALGRLSAERDRLRKERKRLEPEISSAAEFYKVFTGAAVNGRVWSADERKEIDRLLRMRRRILKRADAIDAQLARIEHEGTAIKKHCNATADEIRAEAVNHAKKLLDAECLELGLKFQNAALRRRFLETH